ncbi:uncharacterized protein [Hemitrygon akajei]|uniref:uncharacterized protein n=1 Tax=Hemitrygon akajei TaxID=2704970 RepID=UPI003BF9B016
MLHWRRLALSFVFLALWVHVGRAKPSSPRLEGAGWNRRAFDSLNGKVVCQRQADPERVRDLLRKGDMSIDTFCRYSLGKEGENSKDREFAKKLEDGLDLVTQVRSQDCLGPWEWEMLRTVLQARMPQSACSRCEAEKGAPLQSLNPRLNLNLLHKIITLPLIQVSWKEIIELEFQNSLRKEALKEMKLYSVFLVFFLDDEKDWLPSKQRNFSIIIRKGRWSKNKPVCVADDSKYIVLELPAKACKWFCSRTLHLTLQMSPVAAERKNWTAVSQQDCARLPGASECQESLPQKLLFAWDKKRYTRITPTILAVLKRRRLTKNKDH